MVVSTECIVSFICAVFHRQSAYGAVSVLAVRAAPCPAVLLHPGLCTGCPASHHPLGGPDPLPALQPALPGHSGPPTIQVMITMTSTSYLTIAPPILYPKNPTPAPSK